MRKNAAKHALLMSVISLLLCVSMLVGTTFAWFTDEVTSSNNKIQSGTLQVDLELLGEDGEFKSIKESKTPIFYYDLWEPGYTDVKVLKIENEGTLALKWYAKFQSASALSKLAEVIDVYVLASETKLAAPDDRNLEGYTRVGTVADFVDTIESTTNGTLYPAGTESQASVAYLGIALKMQESAGNEYQGLELGAFDIQIVATQETYEPDSFNNQYDKDAQYPMIGNTTKDEGIVTTVRADNVEIAIPAEAPAGNYSIVITNKNEATDENGQTTYTADIDLLKDGVKVERNDNTVYLVTIKLGEGKSIVKVLHKGVEVNDYAYDPESGILTFKTDSFSPFSVIYEENKSVKVNSSEEFLSVLANAEAGTIIDATGVTVVPIEDVNATITIPAGVSVKGAEFAPNGACWLLIGEGDQAVAFEDCTFIGLPLDQFKIATKGCDDITYTNCTFTGMIMINNTDKRDAVNTFNNCSFGLADGFIKCGYVNCMAANNIFNQCTFNYAGGSTMGSNQYLQWNAVNSYSENTNTLEENNYTTYVELNGCVRNGCGTHKNTANSTLIVK